MVGPYDGVYYCTSKSAGYCDRRSGACFCFFGYIGADCSRCRSTHYLASDGTCAPAAQCPNGCSGAGSCNATTGVCACQSGRVGPDCSLTFCRTLHR